MGPVHGTEVDRFRRALAEHDALLFSWDAGADIQYDPQNTTFQQILEQLPAGWEPEVVIFWSPEYHPIPAGLEQCPYRLVAALGDWNLALWRIRDTLRMFDHILTDKQGVQVLQRLGSTNVSHAKLYGYDPALHRRLPAEPKVYDVGFVGNLSHTVQGERARFLQRLARLSEKYHICIATGLYGEEYTRFLNRCRIVFNRSIRGEMNMRAYEAPACGCLLLYEADNLEVRDVYQEGVHFVPYTDDNLEQVIEQYLAHPEQAERIVEAAWQCVQDYSYARQYARLIEQAIEAVPPTQIGRMRTFCQLNKRQQARACAHQHLQSAFAGRVRSALTMLSRCEDEPDAISLNDEGVLLLLLTAEMPDAGLQRDCLSRAEQKLLQAIEQEPTHAVALMNYALMLYATGRLTELEGWAHRALKALPECPPEILRDALPWSPGYDWFRIESERAFAEMGHTPEAFAEQLRGFYAQKLCVILGELYASRDALHSAIHMYQRAFELHPQLAQPLAQMLMRLNRHEEAIQWLQRAIEKEPLNIDHWVQLAPILQSAGHTARLQSVCHEALLIVQACPHLTGYRAFFEQMLRGDADESRMAS